MKNPRKGDDIADRLMRFAANVLWICRFLPSTVEGRHIRKQLTAAGTSPGANYEEARCAESRADFVHKIRTANKEMRESCLREFYMQKANNDKDPALCDKIPGEEQKKHCAANIYRSLAMEKKDSKLCQKIQVDFIKNECLNMFKKPEGDGATPGDAPSGDGAATPGDTPAGAGAANPTGTGTATPGGSPAGDTPPNP